MTSDLVMSSDLAAHCGAIAAADFFTTEVWTVRGWSRCARSATFRRTVADVGIAPCQLGMDSV
jgi:hypothetical protein